MARILITDDERPIRRILKLLLSEQGHSVEEAESGEACLELTQEFQPDLVLLDLQLPGIDGLETLQELRATDPDIDILMITAFGSIASAVEAMRRGARDYLTKPFDNDELLMVVERTLEVRELSSEVARLRGDLESRYGFSEIIGISPALQDVFRTMSKVARVDATVLVTGESGTGKELVARAIHRKSGRSRGPFVAVNCSAIPQTLVESEFFGHERGAFTDARTSKPGRFEQAEGGTIFLDEIGDLALDAQAKLLRALQERQIQRVGGQQTRSIDVRVIAATHRKLEQSVRQGRFREDLFWRLNVVQVVLPALRERRQDLPLLIDHFVDRFNRELGLSVTGIQPAARRLLVDYDWPGNVRELENTLCRAMVLCDGETLTTSDFPGRVRGEQEGVSPPASDLEQLPLAEAVQQATERLEKMMILGRLAEHQGNRRNTAASLGISRKTLFNKMRQYELGDDDIEPAE